MMRDFPFPITEQNLSEFCHPHEFHVFAKPARLAGEIVAGNGYLCLKARKGRWMDDEFPEAGSEFCKRVARLPWKMLETFSQDKAWRALADIRGDLKSKACIHPWLNLRCAPSPVWRVGLFLCRLSHLQLIARLPRCEVFIGAQSPNTPLLFRFSGGVGIVARDEKLQIASREVFKPRTDVFTGRSSPAVMQQQPRFAQPGVNWPPPEPVDD